MSKNRIVYVAELGKRAAGLAAVGLNRVFGNRAVGTLGILAYHRAVMPVPGLPKPTINVPPKQFREQLVGLLDRGFQVWPLRHALQHHARKQPIPPRTVVLTFDDAYESVYLNAWPILRELRLPATVFVSTAYLDDDRPFPFDPWGVAYEHEAPAETYRPLRSNQCREMAAGGLIELGVHTHTHQDFCGRPDAFQRDLQRSVDVLQSRFGVSEVTFAFPFGRRGREFPVGELEAAARRTTVLCGLTTEDVPVGPNCDPFRWGRFNVYDWDTRQTLAAKLEGWYGWAPKLYDWAACALHSFAGSRGVPNRGCRRVAFRKRRECGPVSSAPWSSR